MDFWAQAAVLPKVSCPEASTPRFPLRFGLVGGGPSLDPPTCSTRTRNGFVGCISQKKKKKTERPDQLVPTYPLVTCREDSNKNPTGHTLTLKWGAIGGTKHTESITSRLIAARVVHKIISVVYLQTTSSRIKPGP